MTANLQLNPRGAIMKLAFKILTGCVLSLLVSARVAAQQPVISVSITDISVASGDGVAAISVTFSGIGYTSPPAVTISGGGGTGATAVATVAYGSVLGINITNPGSGYTSVPTVTLTGGGATFAATAVASLGSVYTSATSDAAADVNESSGPAGVPIMISALGLGTFLEDSYTYSFFVNGISIGETPEPVFPPLKATVMWTPPQPGSYFLTVTATDGVNTATSLAVRYFATGTVVNSPLNNTLVPQGSSVVLKADATVAQGFIKQMQFYDNGVAIGEPDTTLPYSLIYTPSGGSGTVHAITAEATDNEGGIVPMTGSPITMKVVTAITPLPTSTISSPSSGSGIAIPATNDANIPITVDASSPTGRIAKVELYIDGELFGTGDVAYPYSFAWHPTVVGTYNLVALAYDDKNNVIASTTSTAATSTPAPTVVRIAAPPSVTVTAPAEGSTVAGGVSLQLSANATDSNPGGSISSVQFFVDGTFVGVVTAPSSGNTYSITTAITQATVDGEPVPSVITAIAINGFDISGVSNAVSVNVTNGGSDNGDGPDDDEGGGTVAPEATETVYSGSYQGIATAEGGRVVLANIDAERAVLIGYTSGANPQVYFYSGIKVDSTGAFSLTSGGATTVSGTFSDTGAMGSFDSGRLSFIIPANVVAGSSSVAAGVYSGTILGRSGSAITGVVSPDGGLAVYISDGTYRDAGSGPLANGGTFSLILVSGARLVGTVDPISGFLNATLSGAPVTGTVAAALATGGNASDGVLRNISTRGLVGTGENVLIAGFAISGSAPKQVMVRAIGPTLSTRGIAVPVSNPRVDIYRMSNGVSTFVAGNDNWGGDAMVASLSSQLAGDSLNSASLDAALVTTLSPGLYTAVVSDVGGSTGVGLVEVWDAATPTAFSEEKVVNVSTRGRVETGERLLIAGFVVNGSAPKRVLVRAIGPGLTALGVSGALADPLLKIVSLSGTTIRENDNWEAGNDPSLIADVATRVGAQPPLAAGSKDSAILITLPPGLYTAQVTIGSGSAGVALVEVYEVP